MLIDTACSACSKSFRAPKMLAGRTALAKAVPSPSWGTGWLWVMSRLLLLALLVLVPLGNSYGAQVVRVATNQGEIVVEVDDPQIKVVVKEKGVVLQDGPGRREITVKAGTHELEVTIQDAAGETRLLTKKLTLSRGGKEIVNVRQELAALTKNSDVKLIETVLNEISTPSLKGGNYSDATIKFEMLPPFSEKVMKDYSANDSPTLVPAIQKARAMLWAFSTATPPEILKKDVEDIRVRSKVNLSYLKDGFAAPADEPTFKNEIEKHEREVADMIDDLEHAYKKYAEIEIDRTKEPKRWLANYDYIKARMEEQIAYLYEYQSMLGKMRKELPPLDKAQGNGWKLAAKVTMSGDMRGRKMAKSSAKLLDQIAEEHKGTPWEVLAKREKLTKLGLEWTTATVK